MTTVQKFKKGDLVRVDKKLMESMAHFESDCDAVVEGSYHDQFGGGDTEQYTLHLEGGGTSSWYYEGQLTLIESGREDLIETWKLRRELKNERDSDLDYIFSREVPIEETASASIQILANNLGVGSLWGSRGEGYVWFQNALMVIDIATPYLEKGDKGGWLEFCEGVKNKKREAL